MKSEIYGRKVGSDKPFALLIEGAGATTSNKNAGPEELQTLLQFQIDSTRRTVKMLREKSIEGYVQFEGDSTRYAFTPTMDFDYPGVPAIINESEETMGNPYLEAFDLVKQNSGTSGQAALAKCILSLYNNNHAFSIGEILGPLDERYTKVVLAMVNEYAVHGETDELCQAGRYVYENFPRLVQLSKAMSDARYEVRREWERQEEEENRRLYPDEYK